MLEKQQNTKGTGKNCAARVELPWMYRGKDPGSKPEESMVTEKSSVKPPQPQRLSGIRPSVPSRNHEQLHLENS